MGRWSPKDILSGAAKQVERPRIMVVDNKLQDTLTKGGPPEGMYVANYEQENLQQWDGFQWQIVAETLAGYPELSPGLEPVRVGAGQQGGGGGGITPAPRGPGDGSITDPVPGTPCVIISLFEPGPVEAGQHWFDGDTLWQRDPTNSFWSPVAGPSPGEGCFLDPFDRVLDFEYGLSPDGHEWDASAGGAFPYGVDGQALYMTMPSTFSDFSAALLNTFPLGPITPWMNEFTALVSVRYDVAIALGDSIEVHLKTLGGTVDLPQCTLVLGDILTEAPRLKLGIEGDQNIHIFELPSNPPLNTPIFIRWHRDAATDTNEAKVWWNPNPEPDDWQVSGAVGSTDDGSDSFIYRMDVPQLTNQTTLFLDFLQFDGCSG